MLTLQKTSLWTELTCIPLKVIRERNKGTGRENAHITEDQPMDITNLYSSESHTGKKQRHWERECSQYRRPAYGHN